MAKVCESCGKLFLDRVSNSITFTVVSLGLFGIGVVLKGRNPRFFCEVNGAVVQACFC